MVALVLRVACTGTTRSNAARGKAQRAIRALLPRHQLNHPVLQPHRQPIRQRRNQQFRQQIFQQQRQFQLKQLRKEMRKQPLRLAMENLLELGLRASPTAVVGSMVIISHAKDAMSMPLVPTATYMITALVLLVDYTGMTMSNAASGKAPHVMLALTARQQVHHFMCQHML